MTSNRKAKFLADLDDWQQEVEEWWETTDKFVKDWNTDISTTVTDGIFSEKQAETLRMVNISPLSRIGLGSIREIYLTDSISPTLRRQIITTIKNYLEEAVMRIRDHVNIVHNICINFLEKDKQVHIDNRLLFISDIEILIEKLQYITSLEHAVQNIENPTEALEYLYSVATNGFEFGFTTSSFNSLIHELADKIDEGENQSDVQIPE